MGRHDPRARQDPILVANRALRQAARGGPAGRWPNGTPLGQAFVVADGLGSQSHPDGANTHWSRLLRPAILRVDPGAEVRGFSYFYPGYRYYGKHTDVSILVDAPRLFAPYAPAWTTPISYAAFSLGGPIITLGCDAWLREAGQTSFAMIRHLFLAQPAFAVQEAVVQTLEPLFTNDDRKRLVVTPVAELVTEGAAIRERCVEALRTITAAGTRVHLLYWPGDSFVAYPEAFLAELDTLGVALHKCTLEFRSTARHAFQHHVEVARHPAIRKAIRRVLATDSESGAY